jgi:hypothetical protein
MSKLDKGLAARMMQAGDSDSKIAAVFGTTRQAVNLLRRSLVTDGKLAAAGFPVQERSPGRDPLPMRKPDQTERTASGNEKQEAPRRVRPTLDQLTDWMIQIIRDAGETRRLRLECQAAQARIESLQQEVAGLRKGLQRLDETQAEGLRKANELEAAIEHTEAPGLREEGLTYPSS